MDLTASILNEIEKCEILRRHPHPNIVQYLGCLVEDGKIYGLCFVRYQQDLVQRMNETPTKSDLDECIKGVESGLKHLHSLGLVHCDLDPMNTMMSDDYKPVIIDFDPCTFEGKPLGVKAGTWGWIYNDSGIAYREGDLRSLLAIKKYVGLIEIPYRPRRSRMLCSEGIGSGCHVGRVGKLVDSENKSNNSADTI